MPSGELAQLKFAVVEATSAPFAFREAAILWAKGRGVVGVMGEGDTGGKGCVGISVGSLREMLNPVQIGKSCGLKAYAYHVTRIEVLAGTIGNDLTGTAPNANTPTTNQEEANLHLTADILLNGVCDVNGVPLLDSGKEG